MVPLTAIIGFIADKEGLTAQEVINKLNYESGYLGISGISSDARDLRKAVEEENHHLANLAIQIQNKRIVDYIASYYVYMGGADAIVFTAGIGERSQKQEKSMRTLKRSSWCRSDKQKNIETWGIEGEISTPNSKIKVL